MRSRLVWFLAVLGIAAAAAARFLRKRATALPAPAPERSAVPERVAPPAATVPPAPPAPEPPTVEEEDRRAEELRRRIEESRLLVDERDEFEAAETPLDEADPEARRREVHDRARQMVERMRGEQEQS